MSYFDKCKNCSVMVENGSGVLFQPKTDEYSYILTAKHNLISDNPSISLNVNILGIYKHPTYDIAIIKIGKIDIVTPLVQKRKPKDREYYKLYAYPTNRRDKEKKIHNFDLNITDIENFEIVVSNTGYAEQSDIDGCSDGGVFREEKDTFYLAGIECRMDKESEEENNTNLRFISIGAFDEIVDKYKNELIYLYKYFNYYSNRKKKDNNIYIERKIDKEIKNKINEKQGSVLFLDGQGGIGKSTLLVELQETINIPSILININNNNDASSMSEILLDRGKTTTQHCPKFEAKRVELHEKKLLEGEYELLKALEEDLKDYGLIIIDTFEKNKNFNIHLLLIQLLLLLGEISLKG